MLQQGLDSRATGQPCSKRDWILPGMILRNHCFGLIQVSFGPLQGLKTARLELGKVPDNLQQKMCQ